MATETQTIKKKEKNITPAGQGVRIAAGIVAILLGVMSPSLDSIWMMLPIVNPLIISSSGNHTFLYGLVQLGLVGGGFLGTIQGATGRCWIRAMGFKTPI